MIKRFHPRTVLLIVAVWFPFLLFAEFGLLGLVRERIPEGPLQPAVLACLVVPGIAAALGSASRPRALREGLFLTALGGLAPLVPGIPGALLAAPLVGFGLGLASAGLAGDLVTLAGGRDRAIASAALGTALGYLGANLPGVFDASPAMQGAIAAMVAAAGIPFAGRTGPDQAWPADTNREASPDRRHVTTSLVLLLGGLVATDSLLFAAIQGEAEALAASWGTPGGALALGTIHLVASLLAGIRLTSSNLPVRAAACGPALAFMGLLLLAVPGMIPAALYAAAVSTYSLMLVLAPSLLCDGPREARLLAGRVFAWGGWLASAVGLAVAGPRGTPSDLALVTLLLMAVPASMLGANRLRRGPARPLR